MKSHFFRTRPGVFAQGPALVLLHGLGSNENDLFGLTPHIDGAWTVYCLRAPIPYGFGGYAWFGIDWNEAGIVVDHDEIAMSRDHLVETLRHLRGEHSHYVVGGFSQGAMMSLASLDKEPDLFDGGLLMSGAVPPGLAGTSLAGKRLFVAHGVSDPVLPIALGRQVAETVAGADLTYREYDMPHSVCEQEIADFSAWLDFWTAGT